ncbi:hypothetical protein PAECIP111893_00481 [Paenibacillus plantiphilus]|uniref:Zinc ribbon domain-containing protein n=1 Tax=Paenibacillus plantiphilus TaxID=2905650 RepID=A0ABN8G1B4_9BACL|nr:hypothetical protein [Paenibacillus plantiphilus]CAH1193512.1 hypothetical protein PAECIP111893_00481 [Paenibacillus plantiphilus]
MYCGTCGTQVAAGTRFCGGCGNPVGGEELQEPSSPKITVPKIAMSKRAKVLASVIIGVVGLAAIAYGIAHYTYGPATPEKLNELVQQAITERNVDELASYLDPSQDSLKEAASMEAFKQAFTEETAAEYARYFKQAANLTILSGHAGSDNDHAAEPNSFYGPFILVKESSWRGTKWSFKVNVSSLKVEKPENWKIESALGTLKNDTGSYSELWPAIYKYSIGVSNAYGGTEQLEGTVSLINNSAETLNLEYLVQSNVSVPVPTFKDITFKLNGVELGQDQDSSMQWIDISPAPKEMKLEVSGSYLGKTIETTESLDPASIDTDTIKLVVNKEVAQIVADIVLKANVSWTKATNTGDASLITGFDPDEWTYKQLVANITGPSEEKLYLARVAVNPENIVLSGDEIRFDGSEEYTYAGGKASAVSNNGYSIQKQPNSDEWWIVSLHESWFASNQFENEASIIVENAEKPPAEAVVAPEAPAGEEAAATEEAPATEEAATTEEAQT